MKKKVNTKATKSKVRFVFLQKTNLQLACFVFLALLVGGITGYVVRGDSHDTRYQLASRAEIKSIKKELTAQFQAENSTDCGDSTDPITPQDRVEVFQKYLAVNKYGNRAVIRGCNDIDALLVKNPISGKWEQTVVNVSLDLRANPNWQRECLIDDITTADDTVRPENSSIDTTNFVACRQILEREQIVDILMSSGVYKSSEITQKDVDEYIKAAEDFTRL